VTTARVEELTPESFASFGRLVARPARAHDAGGPGWRWWAEVARLTGEGRVWGFGRLDLEPTALRFDWAERHLQTEEAVIATTADILVYVAPAEGNGEGSRPPRPEEFRVFRLPAMTGVVLERGVWHGAPLATRSETTALVLILEGTGHNDVVLTRFPGTPVEIEFEGGDEHG
jgi:ureidoglycolate lyase